MAREDSRWFAAAVVALSIVLFMALPLAILISVDHLEQKAKMKAEVRKEIRELKNLKEELRKEVEHVANSRRDHREPDK
jgi:uncharacterized protein YlxW (UPF0749 family)